MDEFDFFAFKSKKANKTNSSVHFLGESMAHQSAFKINWPLGLGGLVSRGNPVGKIDLVVDFLSSISKNKAACKPRNFLIAPSKNLFSYTFNFNNNLVCPIK